MYLSRTMPLLALALAASTSALPVNVATGDSLSIAKSMVRHAPDPEVYQPVVFSSLVRRNEESSNMNSEPQYTEKQQTRINDFKGFDEKYKIHLRNLHESDGLQRAALSEQKMRADFLERQNNVNKESTLGKALRKLKGAVTSQVVDDGHRNEPNLRKQQAERVEEAERGKKETEEKIAQLKSARLGLENKANYAAVERNNALRRVRNVVPAYEEVTFAPHAHPFSASPP